MSETDDKKIQKPHTKQEVVRKKVTCKCKKLFTAAHRETYCSEPEEMEIQRGRQMELYTDEGAKREQNKPSVSLGAAEHFHLPCSLQSTILSPAQMNTYPIFSISIFRLFKVTSASIFKVFTILDQHSFRGKAFCFT